MKIKKILKLLSVIHDSKLPYDMELLDKQFYTSESQGKTYAIDDMDIIHLIRSFIKIYNYDEGLQQSVSQTNQIMKLEQEVSHLRERVKNLSKQTLALQDLNIQMKERNQDLHKRLEKKSYKEVTAPRYVFSEIPNDCDGQRFVDDMRKYFNKSRYNLRIRGQHIKEELKGRGLTTHGQSIDQSTHLRVYIEEK